MEEPPVADYVVEFQTSRAAYKEQLSGIRRRAVRVAGKVWNIFYLGTVSDECNITMPKPRSGERWRSSCRGSTDELHRS